MALVLVACGGDKDEAAPSQPPPEVVKVADLEPPTPKGSRYANARFLVQISFTEGSVGPSPTTVQTHVSVVDDQLFFTRTPHGTGGERVNRALTLSAEEQQRIAQLVRDNRLGSLETIRLARQPDAPHAHASASVRIRLDGAEHAFVIAGVTELEGAATAFSETAAFRGVAKVVADVQTLVAAR